MWESVSQNPGWQQLFLQMGLADEIPPAMLPSLQDPATPPAKQKSVPGLDTFSPPKDQQAPKRVQSARAATIGQPKPEAPFLKKRGQIGLVKAKQKGEDVDDLDELPVVDMPEDAEDSLYGELLPSSL